MVIQDLEAAKNVINTIFLIKLSNMQINKNVIKLSFFHNNYIFVD